MMRKPTTKEVARFFDKVQITSHCWLWMATTFNGYGLLGFNGKTVRAHRFSYELFVALIEPGKMILHRRECGNRNCINPHHLYMGTHADNMRDKEIWGKSAENRVNRISNVKELEDLAGGKPSGR